METAGFNLENYLTQGVEKIVKGMLRAAIRNPDAAKFITRYMIASRAAAQKRHDFENQGEHIPPFLIASITNACNLHCTGCYARANHICFDRDVQEQLLTAEEWGTLFKEAEELGISFILLAGGEPVMRPDVLKAAGCSRNIVFPVFTNGTLINQSRLGIFRDNPNLLPVVSIEGGSSTTDSRRGEGIHSMLMDTMELMKNNGIVFGASVTVTRHNVDEVMGEEFINSLGDKGCKAVIYVEYVPVDRDAADLAPDDSTREHMKVLLEAMRMKIADMLFVSFPGDEKTSGGCLAAGRGFFHINAFGAAEPCPFSAYSDTSTRELGIREALKSPLFYSLNESGILKEEHQGGCVLYEKEEQVKSLCMK